MLLTKALRLAGLKILDLDVCQEDFAVPDGQTLKTVDSLADVELGRKLMIFLHCGRGDRDFKLEAIYDVMDSGLKECSFYLKDWDERHSENPKSSEKSCFSDKHRKYLRVILLTVTEFAIAAPRLRPDMTHIVLEWLKWEWELVRKR